MSDDGKLVARGAAIAVAGQALVPIGVLVFGGDVLVSWIVCWFATAKASGPARHWYTTTVSSTTVNVLICAAGLVLVGRLLDSTWQGKVDLLVVVLPVHVVGAFAFAAVARTGDRAQIR